MAGNQNMDDVGRLPSSNCPKVFIQRDYQDGCNVRFQKKFPQELEARIERAAFENTVDQLNTLYSEAEALSGRTYCESCFACLTAYLAYLCMTTQYEKTLKKIERYIRSQNEDVYHPRGLHLIDPVQRGLRVLEICIVSEASPR